MVSILPRQEWHYSIPTTPEGLAMFDEHSWRGRLVASCKDPAAFAPLMEALPPLTGRNFWVAGLTYAPVKGWGMVSADQLFLGPAGLETPDGVRDRGVMIVLLEGGTGAVSYDGRRFSQRDDGAMALFEPSVNESVFLYSVRGHPKFPHLVVSRTYLGSRTQGDTVRILLYQSGGVARFVGGVLEEEKGLMTSWLRRVLATLGPQSDYRVENVRVLFTHGTETFEVEEQHRVEVGSQTLFTDGGKVTIASVEDLAWVNAGLKREHGEASREIPAAAYRMNIWLTGQPAGAIDCVRDIEIGPMRARITATGAVVRCSVPSVDQATGRKPDKEPGPWLTTYHPRRLQDGKPCTFGRNADYPRVERKKLIAAGQMVRVLSEME